MQYSTAQYSKCHTKRKSQRQLATLFFLRWGALAARLIWSLMTSSSWYSPLPPTEPDTGLHSTIETPALTFGAGSPVRLGVEVVVIHMGMDPVELLR